MIKLLFNFKDKKNNVINEYYVEEQSDEVIFNDAYMNKILEKNKTIKDRVKSWDIFIDCNMATIIVDAYTLTEKFFLQSFQNSKSLLSILKANETKLHLVDIDIHHLETEKCGLFLANSKIDELYCDIKLIKKTKSTNSLGLKYFGKFDLKNCIINKAFFYQNIRYLTIRDSSISRMSFHFKDKTLIHTKGLYIQNSIIKAFNCNFYIDKLSIRDSEVNKVNFMPTARIEFVTLKRTKIDHVFGCNQDTITKKNLDGWYLIKKSNYKVNTYLYCVSGYHICKLENKLKIQMEKNIIKRIGLRCSDLFLRWSIGYAYKPANAVLFTLLSITAFAFIYSGIDWTYVLLNNQMSVKDLSTNIKVFLENLYWSGITFTTIGYGEIGAQDWISRFLAIVEGCLGISTMSLLVIALSKKYLE